MTILRGVVGIGIICRALVLKGLLNRKPYLASIGWILYLKGKTELGRTSDTGIPIRMLPSKDIGSRQCLPSRVLFRPQESNAKKGPSWISPLKKMDTSAFRVRISAIKAILPESAPLFS